MSLKIPTDDQIREAVRQFWRSRASAADRQAARGRRDQGARGAVTAGKNMDGFVELAAQTVLDAGLPERSVYRVPGQLTLPGYFRPTKMWGLLVVHDGELVAALEFKSHVGPSFGNNANNRVEEALGTATDLAVAFREGTFPRQAAPFLGYLILVEEAPASTRAVRATSPHFPPRPEFVEASYVGRHGLLCDKLVRESLFTAATAISSPATAAANGKFGEIPPSLPLKTFFRQLAARATAAA